MSSALPEGSTNNNGLDRRRRVHRKVKTGCTACKVRRQKCDEQRPRCYGCVRHATDCLYTTPKRRSQGDPAETGSVAALAAVNRAAEPLAPLGNPPISPSNDLNLEDLELLHQYITSTCVATSQLPERTAQIQTNIPRLAQIYPFLMRGILGNAAIHLSWLRPARKAHYTLLAARHHSIALPNFRKAMENIDEDNYSAVIFYSKGLVWSSFARFETVPGNVETTSGSSSANWLPKWFQLLRGSCLVVKHCAAWINSGMHVMPSLDDTTEFWQSLDNYQLSMLQSQILLSTVSSTYMPIMSDLKEAFARASMRHQNTPLRNAINFWIGAIPNEFVNALQEGEPWALVILAHFCILIFRSETRWFMRGHAIELLRSIKERLAESWDQHIQWPCDEIGYQLDALSIS